MRLQRIQDSIKRIFGVFGFYCCIYYEGVKAPHRKADTAQLASAVKQCQGGDAGLRIKQAHRQRTIKH